MLAKTKLMHFNNQKILPGNVSITIDSVEIKSSSCIRFLGIFFDYDMTFKTQLNYVLKKCHKTLDIIISMWHVVGSTPRNIDNIIQKLHTINNRLWLLLVVSQTKNKHK